MSFLAVVHGNGLKSDVGEDQSRGETSVPPTLYTYSILTSKLTLLSSCISVILLISIYMFLSEKLFILGLHTMGEWIVTTLVQMNAEGISASRCSSRKVSIRLLVFCILAKHLI